MLDDQYPARTAWPRTTWCEPQPTSHSSARRCMHTMIMRHATGHLYLALHHQFVGTSICVPKLCCAAQNEKYCLIRQALVDQIRLEFRDLARRFLKKWPCICPAEDDFDKLRRWQWMLLVDVSRVFKIRLSKNFSFLVLRSSLYIIIHVCTFTHKWNSTRRQHWCNVSKATTIQ